VLFELDEAIRNLPGATAARNLLLARATEFLDNLANDQAADAALKTEVAEGYRRLGHVQGSSFSDNLGLRDRAIESYRKAVRMGEQAMAQAPREPGAGIVLLGAYDDLTNVYTLKNDLDQADVWYRKHRGLLAEMERRYPGDRKVRASAASSYSALAFYRTQRNDLAGAKEDYRNALGMFAALTAGGFDSADISSQYAFALKRLGAILITENSLEEAERCYRKALEMEDARLATASSHGSLRIDRTFTLSDLALISKRKKDFEGAARLYEEVVETRRTALAQDTGNVRLINLTAGSEVSLAGVYSVLHRHREALALCREAVGWRDKALAAGRGFREQWESAAARVMLAFRVLDAARDSAAPVGEAVAALDAARPFVEGLERRQDLSLADRSLTADYREARQRLVTRRR
jgi:tetratricopeptide (TPR) repeat protein